MKLCSSYAKRVHAIILEYTQKYQIKMPILTENNWKFENRLDTHLIGPKWKFLENIFLIAHQKILVHRMLKTMKIFEHQKLEKIEGKELKFFLQLTKDI